MPGRRPGGRDRILHAAMDLFGRQGFRATTIAEIEEAAGLSPGAGGIYRHFASKRALLEAGLQQLIHEGPSIAYPTGGLAAFPGSPRDALLAIAQAGLRRLESERDLNRLLLRDLAEFPELLAQVRDAELRRVHEGLRQWLSQAAPDIPDAPGLAAVLMSAVSHYWIMTDVFGTHPLGIDARRNR
ncbi:MAG: TetR/AcrR family transcriptional regulator [Nocardioidaceae bacterium]